MCNEEFPHPPIPAGDPIPGPVPPITVREVEKALSEMKNGKAPGPDDTPAEAWTLLGKRGAEILATLFNKVVDDGAVPPK